VNKLVSEVFDEFEKATSENDKVNVLRFNNSIALRKVLYCTFHPNIQFSVKQWPTFKPSDDPAGLTYGSLHTEMDRVYLFIEGHERRPSTLTEKRSNEILTQMLENMTSKEAYIMLNMMSKNLKIKGLTKEVALAAYPNLFEEAI